MKKIVSFIIVIVMILCLLTTCNRKHEYPLRESEIVSINIVSLKHNREKTTICKIENVSDFLNDFKKIEVRRISPPNDSSWLNTQTAIEIKHSDGTFNWIVPTGFLRSFYKDTGNLATVFHGSNLLDDKQFADLIAKYVGKSDLKLEYHFLQSSTKISAIEIVRLGESENDLGLIPKEQTVIGKVDDVSEFLKKFEQLDCYLNINQPTKAEEGSIAVKISYNGGDGGNYELINAHGQSISYYTCKSYNHGLRYFDEEQFANLIEDYIDK